MSVMCDKYSVVQGIGGREMSRMLRFAVVVLTIVSFSAPMLRAQQTLGSINGTVTDSSGAVVPEVTVVAFNTGNGQARTVSSDASGNFEFIQLPIGTYVDKVKGGWIAQMAAARWMQNMEFNGAYAGKLAPENTLTRVGPAYCRPASSGSRSW